MSTDNIENEIRTTPEYAAVFALEKWRTTQIKKWNDDWQTEKKKRVRDLENSFADRAEDLEQKAASLESLGEKLKMGFQALEAQKKDQDRREQHFAANQLQSASETESTIQTTQDRCRRMVGEIQAKLEHERSRARELEQVIHENQAQKKMQTSSNATLNEKLLQVQKRDADHAAALASKDVEIFDLRKDLAECREKASTLQRQFTEAQSRIFKLEENSQFYRSEAKRVVTHHNRLLEEIFKEREEKLKMERLNLEHQMMVGGSPSCSINSKKQMATSNCVDAALKRTNNNNMNNKNENDQVENENNNQDQQQNKYSTPLTNGIHSELKSMADMIEQLARSIDQAEGRDKKRDEETAKIVSEAVRESMINNKININKNKKQTKNDEDENDEETIIMDDEDDNEIDEGNESECEENETHQDNVFVGRNGNITLKDRNHNHRSKYVGNRYVQSPEYYELRPTGLHSKISGIASSSFDSVLSTEQQNNNNNNSNGGNDHQRQNRGQKQHQDPMMSSYSAPNSNEATLDSNTPEKNEESSIKTKQRNNNATTKNGRNQPGLFSNLDIDQLRRDALSRIPKEHQGLIVNPEEYYSRSERIPSVSIRGDIIEMKSQNENNINNNADNENVDDDDDDDSVRLEGDDTLLNNNNNNNNTAAGASDVSIPEEHEDLAQFDNIIQQQNNNLMDFGPHGEKIDLPSKTTTIHKGNTNNNNNNNIINDKKQKTGNSPRSSSVGGASTTASTNLQMNNNNNGNNINNNTSNFRNVRQATAAGFSGRNTTTTMTNNNISTSSGVGVGLVPNRGTSPLPHVPVVDSEAFLLKLQQNRDRLIATGVYKSGDRIIVEMDQRIQEYRQKRNMAAVL